VANRSTPKYTARWSGNDRGQRHPGLWQAALSWGVTAFTNGSWRYCGFVVDRAITGFHCDEEGDWVAELSCGHCQHVRHRPPFQRREWALEAEGRRSKVGLPLACPQCDRAELPEGLRLVRSSTEWDEHTMPAGLRRAHRVARGTWGRIVVRQGRLRFRAQTEPELQVVVYPGSTQAIPPEVDHEVQPIGSVRFSVEFLSVCKPESDPYDGEGGHNGESDRTTVRRVRDEGGEPACWAHLLCPECGSLLECGSHATGCHSEPDR
jgi:tellurite methyltransferase